MKTRGTAPHMPPPTGAWVWPLDLTAYDRTAELRPAEAVALGQLVVGRRAVVWARHPPPALERLRRPLGDALTATGVDPAVQAAALGTFARAMWERQRTYWGWDPADWRRVVGDSARACFDRHGMSCRSALVAVGYVLGGRLDLLGLTLEAPTTVARKVFGPTAVDASIAEVRRVAAGWGYGEAGLRGHLPGAIAWALLRSGSPRLEDLRIETLDDLRARQVGSRYTRRCLSLLGRVLTVRGLIAAAPRRAAPHSPPPDLTAEVAAEWVSWCRRWRDTTTVEPPTRQQYYRELLLVGRWLARTHPEVTSPAQWSRELAAEYVAAVDRLTVGARSAAEAHPHHQAGKPLTPGTKAHYLKVLATFFRDCQEWGWLPRRFDPQRVLATPRAIRAQIGPNPRVLGREVWLKLAWAAEQLTEDDLPGPASAYWYPLVLVRALAQTWLWAGLRSAAVVTLPEGVKDLSELGQRGDGRTLFIALLDRLGYPLDAGMARDTQHG